MRSKSFVRSLAFALAVAVLVLGGISSESSPVQAEKKVVVKGPQPQSLSPSQGTISLDINQERSQAAARAVCNLSTGELYLEAILERPPSSFNPLLAFMPILLTGQPRCSRPVGGTRNPFRDASAISFRRTVTFDSREELVADVSYKVEGLRVDATYQLRGTVPNIAVAETVEPTVEFWTPGDGQGSMKGAFRMCWHLTSGKLLCGTATTDYSYERGSRMASGSPISSEHRFITIKAKIYGRKYQQWERITLFRDFPGHEKTFKGVEALAPKLR